MMEEQRNKRRFPWWVWLIIILFPIPFGVVHWWITLVFFAVFAVVIWAITYHHYN